MPLSNHFRFSLFPLSLSLNMLSSNPLNLSCSLPHPLQKKKAILPIYSHSPLSDLKNKYISSDLWQVLRTWHDRV